MTETVTLRLDPEQCDFAIRNGRGRFDIKSLVFELVPNGDPAYLSIEIDYCHMDDQMYMQDFFVNSLSDLLSNYLKITVGVTPNFEEPNTFTLAPPCSGYSFGDIMDRLRNMTDSTGSKLSSSKKPESRLIRFSQLEGEVLASPRKHAFTVERVNFSKLNESSETDRITCIFLELHHDYHTEMLTLRKDNSWFVRYISDKLAEFGLGAKVAWAENSSQGSTVAALRINSFCEGSEKNLYSLMRFVAENKLNEEDR